MQAPPLPKKLQLDLKEDQKGRSRTGATGAGEKQVQQEKERNRSRNRRVNWWDADRSSIIGASPLVQFGKEPDLCCRG